MVGVPVLPTLSATEYQQSNRGIEIEHKSSLDFVCADGCAVLVALSAGRLWESIWLFWRLERLDTGVDAMEYAVDGKGE
jgi:hypothetical protein